MVLDCPHNSCEACQREHEEYEAQKGKLDEILTKIKAEQEEWKPFKQELQENDWQAGKLAGFREIEEVLSHG